MVPRKTRRASSTRSTRRRRLLFAGLVALGLALTAGLVVYWLPNSSTPLDPSGTGLEPGSFVPPGQLSVWARRLESFDVTERRAAEAALAERLLDPAQRRRQTAIARHRSRSPGDWFEAEGAEQVVPTLLARFRSGDDEDAAHSLLVGLARVFPDATREAAQGTLQYGSELAVGHAPVALCRALGDLTSPLAPYYLYQLQQAPARPAARVTLMLMERWMHLPEFSQGRARDLLQRVPDRRLTRLIRHRWPAIPARDAINRIATDRQARYRSLVTWLAADDQAEARHEFIAGGLGSADTVQIIGALSRFRWDPVPGLDASIVHLALGGGENTPDFEPEVSFHAVAALVAVPRRSASRALRRAMGEPRLRDAAYGVLSVWTGEHRGGYRGSWDVAQSPAQLTASVDHWLRVCGRLDRQPLEEEILAAFGDGQARACHFRLVQLLEARGGVNEAWYRQHGPALVEGLDHQDPAVRRWAARDIALWESPAAVPILARKMQAEPNATVRGALTDAILVIGGREGIDTVLTELATSERFEGAEIVEIYRTVFPDADLLTALRRLAEDPQPTVRAGAAFLLAQLPASADTAAPLLSLLADGDERTRFWADRSLARLYGVEVRFDSRKAGGEDEEGVRGWYRVVRNKE